MVQCTGCEKEATQFQCPLCQAEGSDSEGFFCSQECFAKSWLSHRDGFHKGGTVKANSKRKREAPTEETKAPKGQKAKAAAAEADHSEVDAPAASNLRCAPWPPLPSEQELAVQRWAQLTPSLPPNTTRAVVALPETSVEKNMWAAASAAARYIKASLTQQPQKNEFLVVAGSAFTAHAVAWALRCLAFSRKVRMVLSTSDEDMRIDPQTHFSETTPIVVTSTTVIRAEGKKNATNISLWTDNRTLITLPDVRDPEALQSIRSKALYFVGTVTPSNELSAKKGAQQSLEVASLEPEAPMHTFDHDEITHRCTLIPVDFKCPNVVLGTRFDNELCTKLVWGELILALDLMINLFSRSKNRAEEVITNALFCDWGCSDSVTAHHKLAYMMRYLSDRSDKFANSSVNLDSMATRIACRVVKVIEAIPVPSKVSESRNIMLQATLCYLFKCLSLPMVDAFGESWGLTKVVEGQEKLEGFAKKLNSEVVKINRRYGAKLGKKYADFLVILYCLIFEAVSVWSLSLEEVERATSFSALLAHEAGTLVAFLTQCELFGHSDEKSKWVSDGNAADKKRRREKGLPVQDDLSGLVHPPSKKTMPSINYSALPLSGRHQREVDKIRDIAAEEILMAMPRQPIPMYLGDVGNLIGIWTKFNYKYNGMLGYTLSEFLETNPDKFTVVGNIVTRKKAGLAEQVKVRFDNDHEVGSDDDEDNRKRRDRNAVTGLGKKSKKKKEPVYHSAKARKKAEKKERNVARYNKNRQAFDPEKKVPGYVKHGPRKLKGRGLKPNVRSFKREANAQKA